MANKWAVFERKADDKGSGLQIEVEALERRVRSAKVIDRLGHILWEVKIDTILSGLIVTD